MRVWANIKWAFGWPWRIFRLLTRRVDVLVVGSAHIEATGEVHETSAFAQGTDHEGIIIYSVGGGGYNVAVNLAAAGKNPRVALDTMLPKEPRLAELVMSKLVSNGVSLDYVRRLSSRQQGNKGFVEAAMGGRVELRAKNIRLYSVSRTLVGTPGYWTRNRDRIAVNRAKAVVVDTYLFEAAAQEIVKLAVDTRTPVFLLATTDSTAQRFARGIVVGSREASGAVLCIVGIADVIDAMTYEIDPNQAHHEDRIRLLYGRYSTPEPAIAEGICRLLKTSYVACIHERVARIMSWTGDLFEVDLTDIPVTNQKGAADALMAAVVDVFLSKGGRSVGAVGAREVLNLRLPDLTGALRIEIRHHVERAYSSEGATRGSVISFEEPFDSWRQLLERRLKYLGIQGVNALGWLGIAFMINRVAILIGLGDVVRIPFKKLTTIFGAALQWLKAVLTFVFGH